MKNRILIIDDEIDVVSVTVARLEASGYKFLIANSAEEALELLKKDKPDLILLDLLLPNMQGDTLCIQLKSDAKFKGIPIILFTASIVRIPQKIKEMGVDDYVMKPFKPEELLFKIKKLIG